MFGSALLDVAIGMAFLYLLLSLIASAVQEVIALVIQSRAANLLRGIRSVFSGSTLPSGDSYWETLYKHGLIRSLYQIPGVDYDESKARAFTRRITGSIRLGLRWLFGMKVPGRKATLEDLWLPAYIPSRTFALALRDIVIEAQKELPDQAGPVSLQFGQGSMAAALRALYNDASGSEQKLQTNLENWYNDAMDRVSGWYKRYTQNVLLVIGLVLAIVFNVSSIRIVRALWVDKDARTALASEADQYMKQHQIAPKDDTKPDADFDKLRGDLNGTISAYHGAVDSLLPVGWKQTPSTYWQIQKAEGGEAWKRYWLVFLGWVVTAVALSYGAPFWFDVLNKFMVVRSTVKPQEKSQTEGSKDARAT
jgi:hypothetical protein